LVVVFCSIRNSDFEKQSGSQDELIKEASMFNWHWKLIVLFGISVLCVDPLFLYIPVINQDDKCLKLDKRLMLTAICLRSFFDMIYVGNIILGYFSRRQGRTGLNPDDQQPRQIIKRYLRSYLAIDILALLPIPQVREIFRSASKLFFFFFFFLLWFCLSSLNMNGGILS
jgi:cyclic nucleotide gated channel